jgi:hypothetical protein
MRWEIRARGQGGASDCRSGANQRPRPRASARRSKSESIPPWSCPA